MIVDVASRPEEWAGFLELPRALYAGDPDYVPVDPRAERASVGRAKFQGRQRVLIARRGPRCVARVVARLSPTLADASRRPVGMLGFFEAFDEPGAVRDLLLEAARWLRASGAGEIVGPMDGDTWHRYRFNVGPFAHPAFLLEPYNRPTYGALWERCGFQPLESYYSSHVEDVAPVQDALAARLDGIASRGYALRPLETRRFRDELRTLYALTSEVFAKNYFFDPISEPDFLALYDGIEGLIDPQLVWFALRGDRAVGFVFAYPECRRAVAALRGRRDPLARLRFLVRRRGADTVNIKSLGVLESERRAGLGAALMCRVYRSMLERGYRKANLCLIREGNPSGRLEAGAGRVVRRYLLYRFHG